MAQDDARSTGTGAGRSGGDGHADVRRAATDDPPTERFDAATEEPGSSAAARTPARSVPGGVGIPGRAAPRRVLGAHETMPPEPTSTTTAADDTRPAATDDTATAALPAQGAAATDATATTRTATDEDDAGGTGTGRATAASGRGGATAWSATAAGPGGGGVAGGSAAAGSAATTRLPAQETPLDTAHDEATAVPGTAAGAPLDDREVDGARPEPELLAPVVEEPRARRGTLDLALLVLRVGLGADLLAHGLQKLPGLLGGSGIAGYEQLLRDGGYRQPGVLAYVGALTELGAGALLVLGLLTPLAAAGAIGVLVNTWFFREAAAPGAFPFFAGQGGSELELTLLVAAVTVALAGPGRVALDVRRRWAVRPTWDGLAAVVVGGGAGVALWFLLNGANPFA